MGTRAEKWPERPAVGHGRLLLRDRLQSHRRMEGGDRLFDLAKTTNRLAAAAVFPDGTPARLSPDRDPREVFADWLIDPKNPWFTRNIANRVWSWLLGRGIIQEPDDIRPDNPPSNPELLALLEKELIAVPLRPQAPLPADPQLEDLPAFLLPGDGQSRGRGALRVLSAAPPGGRGADRRPGPDHRDDGELFQRHPGAVHFHSRGRALHRAAGRQHQQRFPGNVRASAARHRAGIRAQQPARRPTSGCTCSIRATSGARSNRAG